MHQVTVRIEYPHAADIFAYRGSIYILTYAGHLRAIPTAYIANALWSSYGASGDVASYALFSGKGIGASQRTKSAWKQYDHASDLHLEIALEAIDLGFQIDAQAVLDLRVYYNRAYVATDKGTWSMSITNGERDAPRLSDPKQLTSLATESLSVGMGAVAASLGRNGLVVFLNAWDSTSGRGTGIERESLRSSLGWGLATNYPTNSSYEMLDVEKAPHRGRQVLTEVREPRGDTVELSEDAYALWDGGRLLVGNNHGTSSLGRRTTSSRERTIATRKSGQRRPLWIGTTGNRIVVTELPNALEAGRGERVVTIHNGPVATTRTFPNAHRYRRLIAATVDGGVVLSAVFRDDEDID